MAEQINIKALLPVSMKPLQCVNYFMSDNATQNHEINKCIYDIFLIILSFLISCVATKKEPLKPHEKGYKALVYSFFAL